MLVLCNKKTDYILANQILKYNLNKYNLKNTLFWQGCLTFLNEIQNQCKFYSIHVSFF
jgi:hypothetical protein